MIDTTGAARQNYCFVPHCEWCDAVMKPHCMFFDEGYSEEYYRRESVLKFITKADCLLVMGTALQTSFALNIVKRFVAKAITVIEFNVEQATPQGLPVLVKGKAEETIPQFFEEYFKIKNNNCESSKAA